MKTLLNPNDKAELLARLQSVHAAILGWATAQGTSGGTPYLRPADDKTTVVAPPFAVFEGWEARTEIYLERAVFLSPPANSPFDVVLDLCRYAHPCRSQD